MNDEFFALITHPAVIGVIGGMGSGKTGLCLRIEDRLWAVAPLYTLGLSPRAATILPEDYGLIADPSGIPPDSKAVLCVAEARLRYNARSGLTAAGRALTDLVGLSRQRG